MNNYKLGIKLDFVQLNCKKNLLEYNFTAYSINTGPVIPGTLGRSYGSIGPELRSIGPGLQ